MPAGGGPLLPSYTGGTWLSVPLYALPGSHTAVPTQAVAVCAAQDPESESCGMDPSIWGAARNLWEVLGSTLHPDGWHGGARERDLTTRWMVHRAAASGTQPVAPCRSHQHPQKHTSSVTLRSLNSRRSRYIQTPCPPPDIVSLERDQIWNRFLLLILVFNHTPFTLLLIL